MDSERDWGRIVWMQVHLLCHSFQVEYIHKNNSSEKIESKQKHYGGRGWEGVYGHNPAILKDKEK